LNLNKETESKQVEVEILGQKYTLKGEADTEYLKEIALYVDNKLRNSYHQGSGIPPLKAAIMAAITITDELFKLKAEQKKLQILFEEKTAELLHILYSGASGKNK
jgi:cell division protein ZapA